MRRVTPGRWAPSSTSTWSTRPPARRAAGPRAPVCACGGCECRCGWVSIDDIVQRPRRRKLCLTQRAHTHPTQTHTRTHTHPPTRPPTPPQPTHPPTPPHPPPTHTRTRGLTSGCSSLSHSMKPFWVPSGRSHTGLDLFPAFFEGAPPPPALEPPPPPCGGAYIHKTCVRTHTRAPSSLGSRGPWDSASCVPRREHQTHTHTHTPHTHTPAPPQAPSSPAPAPRACPPSTQQARHRPLKLKLQLKLHATARPPPPPPAAQAPAWARWLPPFPPH
jgi:hypothetical protein